MVEMRHDHGGKKRDTKKKMRHQEGDESEEKEKPPQQLGAGVRGKRETERGLNRLKCITCLFLVGHSATETECDLILQD